MESIYRPKFILNFWLNKVATFGRYNSWTQSWHTVYDRVKYSSERSYQVCFGSSHKCVALVDRLAFTLLSSSSQTSLIGFRSGDCAGHSRFSSLPCCSFLLRWFWQSLDLCFGSPSCCRINLWPTGHRPEGIAHHNAVVALLVQGGAYSVQVTDPGTTKQPQTITVPPPCLTADVETSSRLLDRIQSLRDEP